MKSSSNTPMLREHEPPKEPARVKAERQWTNADLIKELKRERSKPKLVDPDGEPEIADVFVNDGRRDGRVNRFENKFKREIRAMMDGYAARNLSWYLKLLEHRKLLLLKEKLRRLKAAEAQTERLRT